MSIADSMEEKEMSGVVVYGISIVLCVLAVRKAIDWIIADLHRGPYDR